MKACLTGLVSQWLKRNSLVEKLYRRQQRTLEVRKSRHKWPHMGATCTYDYQISVIHTESGTKVELLPLCITCSETLSNEALRSFQLHLYLETKHGQYVIMLLDSFESKLREYQSKIIFVVLYVLSLIIKSALSTHYTTPFLWCQRWTLPYPITRKKFTAGQLLYYAKSKK